MPEYVRKSIRDITDNLSGRIEEKYLTFTIDQQQFGIPIMDVVQIIGRKGVTEIPGFPEFAKGIIYLRGIFIPIIDVRVCFQKPKSEYHDRICILITSIENRKVGLIVDCVETVLNIQPSDISDPYDFTDQAETGFLQGVAQIGKSSILLLDVRKILNHGDLQRITASIEARNRGEGDA